MKKIVQTPQVQLYSGMSGTDVTCRIAPYPKDLNGNKLTMSDFGDNPTFTVDPKIQDEEEINGFTNIIDNGDDTGTLTGLTRNLDSKYPYTSVGTGKSHGANSIVVFSNNPQQEARAAFKENDETITGSWAFPAPITQNNPVRLQDLQNASFSGGVPADENTLGIVRTSASPLQSLGNPTISIASPAVITLANHGLSANDLVIFSTSGNLPTGINAGQIYFVLAAGLGSNTFEISDAAGGTPVTTTGTQSGTHTLTKRTPVALVPTDPRVPTQDENNALAGYLYAPNSSNPFLTKANLSDGNAVDQSQTTKDSAVAFAEADATTKHNLIAQSFIAGKTPIKSVSLSKEADTGTFAGDVTISLQADVSGAPSGTALATITIASAAWLALATGEFTAVFGAEYTAVLGTTYWIVAQATTADNANHPNLSANSAGGYGSGSVKFKNTTDGWTTIPTIDLYFKVNIDLAGKVVQTDSNGQVPAAALQSVISSFTAYEALTAGKPVKFVYDGGDPKLSAIKGLQAYYAQIGGITGTTTYITDCEMLSATAAVAVLVKITGGNQVQFYCAAGTLSGSTWTWGTATAIGGNINRGASPRNDWGYSQGLPTNEDCNDMRIYAVSSTAFIVGGFRILSGASKYGTMFYVGTVSGTTITLGTITNLGLTQSNSDDYSFYGAAKVDTDLMAITLNSSVSGDTKVLLCQINEVGRSISVLDTKACSWVAQTRIATLSTNRFVIWNRTNGNLRIGSVSGGAITLATQQNSGFPSSSGPFAQAISAGKNNTGIVTVVSATNTITTYQFSESGGVVTLGASITDTITGVSTGNGRIVTYDIDEKIYVIGVQGSGNTNFIKVQEGNATTGPIRMLSFNYGAGPIVGGSTGNCSVFYYAKGQLFVFNATNATGAQMAFDWDEFMGYAASSVAAGASVILNKVGDTDSNQSGLTPGVEHYLGANATITPIDSVTVNSLTYATGIFAGRAITPTKIFKDK